MTLEEVRDEVSQEIRKFLDIEIAAEHRCSAIKDNITAYLTQLKGNLGWNNIPVVKVEDEGPFITINFMTLKTID